MGTWLVSGLGVAAEAALALFVVWVASRAVAPSARVLLQRCAFALALWMPALLLLPEPGAALISVPTGASDLIALPAAQALEPATPLPWAALLTAIWALGFTLVCLRCALSHLRLSGAFNHAYAPTSEQAALFERLRREIAPHANVELRISDGVQAPCTFGDLRAKVLLPLDASEASLQAVLAHELWHVRANDALWRTLAQLACAIHWFNPFAWLLARDHAHDSELVCDDAVTTRSVDIDQYVRALVETARGVLRSSGGAAVAMSEQGLDARVRSLLARPRPLPRLTAAVRAGAIAATVLTAFAFATTDIVAAEEPMRTLVDDMRARRSPGEGQIYVEAASDVRVVIGSVGSCGGGSCVFGLPLGTEVALRAEDERGRPARLTGCESTGGVCQVRVSEEPVRVRAYLAQSSRWTRSRRSWRS